MPETWKTWEPEKVEVPGVVMPLAREWLEIERSPEWARMDPAQRAFMRQDYIRGIEAKNKQIGFSPMELQTLKDTVLINETHENDSAYEWVKATVTPAFWASDKARRAAELKWYRRQRRGVAYYHTPESYIARGGAGLVIGETYPLNPALRRMTGVDFFGDELRDKEQGWKGTAVDFVGAIGGFQGNPLMRALHKYLALGAGRVLDQLRPFKGLPEILGRIGQGTATAADIQRATVLKTVWEYGRHAAARAPIGPLFGLAEGDMTRKQMAAMSGLAVLLGAGFDTLRIRPARLKQSFTIRNRVTPLLDAAEAFRDLGVEPSLTPALPVKAGLEMGFPGAPTAWRQAPKGHYGYGVGPRGDIHYWWRYAQPTGAPGYRGVPKLKAFTTTGRAPAIPTGAGAGVPGVPSPTGGYAYVPKPWQGVPLGLDVHGDLWSLRVPEKVPMGWVDSAIMAGAKVVLPNLVGRNVAEIQELVGAIEKGKQFALPAKASEAKRKATLVAKRGIVTGRNVEIAQRLFREELEGAYDAATHQHDTEALKYAEEAADEVRVRTESMPFIDSEWLRKEYPGMWEGLSPNERMRATRRVGGGVDKPGPRFSKGEKELPEKTRKQVEQQYLALMRKVYDPRTGAVKRNKETGKLIKHTKAELEQIDEIETLGKAYRLNLTFRTLEKGETVICPEDFMITNEAGQPVMAEGVHDEFGRIVPQFDSTEEFTRWAIGMKLGGQFTTGRTGISGAKEEAYHEAMGAITKYEFPFPQLRDLEDRMADLAQRGHITAPEMEELHGALETLQRGETPDVLKKIEPIPLSRLSETGVKLQAAQRAIADQKAFDQFEKDLTELAEAEAAEVAPAHAYDALQEQIDNEIDRLMGTGLSFEEAHEQPSARALLEARDVIGRRQFSQAYNDILGRVTDVVKSPVVAKKLLKDIYRLDPAAGDVGMYLASEGTPHVVASAETPQRVAEWIFRNVFAKEKGVQPYEADVLMAGASPLTELGKRELVTRSATLAKQVTAAVRGYFETAPAAAALPAPATTEQRRAAEYPEPTQYEFGKPPQMELGLQQQPYLIDRVADKIAAEAVEWQRVQPLLQDGFTSYVDELAKGNHPETTYLETVWRSARPEKWRSYDDAVAALADEHMAMQSALKEIRPPIGEPGAAEADQMVVAREEAFNKLLDELDAAAEHRGAGMEAISRLEPDDLPAINTNELQQETDKIDFHSLWRKGTEAGGIDIQAALSPIARVVEHVWRSVVRLEYGDPARSKLEMARSLDAAYASQVTAHVIPRKIRWVLEKHFMDPYLKQFPKEERAFRAAELVYIGDDPVWRKELNDPLLEAIFGDTPDPKKKGYFRWAMDRYLAHVNEVFPKKPVPRLPDYIPYMIDWPNDMPVALRTQALDALLAQFRPGAIRHRKSASLHDFRRRLEILGKKIEQQTGLKYELKPITDLGEITERYIRNMILLRGARDFMLTATTLHIPVQIKTGTKTIEYQLPLITSEPARGMYKRYRQLPSHKIEQFWPLLAGGRDLDKVMSAIGDPQTTAQMMKRPIFILADYFEPLMNVIPDMRGSSTAGVVYDALLSLQKSLIFAPSPGIYLKNVFSDAGIIEGSNYDPSGFFGLARAAINARRAHLLFRDPSPESVEAIETALKAELNLGKANDINTIVETAERTANKYLRLWRKGPGFITQASGQLTFGFAGPRIWLSAWMAGRKAMARHRYWGKQSQEERDKVLAGGINMLIGRTPRHKLTKLLEIATRKLLLGPMWTTDNIHIATRAVTGRGFGTAGETPEQRRYVRSVAARHLLRGILHLAVQSIIWTAVLNWVNTGKVKWQFKDYPKDYWFYYGTGRTDERGREIMLAPVFFGYLIDYIRIARDPRRTIRNKLITPAQLMVEFVWNRNTFGAEIMPEDAPFVERQMAALKHALWQSVPQMQLIFDRPGGSDPAEWRAIAYVLGTNIRHMLPGEHKIGNAYADDLKAVGVDKYISSVTNRDIRGLLDKRKYKTAMRMLAERYIRMSDMINFLESYYRPIHYVRNVKMNERLRMKREKEQTPAELKAHQAEIAAEQERFNEIFWEQLYDLLQEGIARRGEPLTPEDEAVLERLRKRMKKQGGIGATRQWPERQPVGVR